MTTYDGARLHRSRLEDTGGRRLLLVVTGDPAQGRLGVSLAQAGPGASVWHERPDAVGYLLRTADGWAGYRYASPDGWGTRAVGVPVGMHEDEVQAAQLVRDAWLGAA